MSSDVLFSIRLSLQVAGLATLILIAVAIPLAYLFARKSFAGKQIIQAIFLLPLVLPPTVIGYYLVVLLGRKGVIGAPIYEMTGWTAMFSWWGAVVASTVVAFPLLFQTAYSAISAIDPGLEQTAYTLGASKLSTFWRVTIPLARRGLLAGIGLTFARALGEFGATVMLAGNIPGRTNTMPLAIYEAFASGKTGMANTLVLVYSVPCIMILGLLAAGKSKTKPLE